MILGSDHAHWDWQNQDKGYCPIDWAVSQSVFTFLKACDGASDTPYYPEAIRDAREAKKLAAPYVWCHGRNWYDPRAQGEFWYNRLKDEPLIAIDFESYGTSVPDHHDLYDAIEALRGCGYKNKIIIYTGHWYWLAHGSTDSYWKQFPVWLARYASESPEPTPPFAKEIIWQFSASGDPDKYGITNGKLAVDENWFYGTQEELEALFGGTYVPPEPGDTDMYQGTCITASLNVRNAPVSGAVVGGLALNDKVEADRVENGWWHLTKIRGVATVGENWSYEGATKGYIRTDAIINPPQGLPVIHLHADGYPDVTWSPL